MAALSRIANGDPKIHVGPGDTVILASSLIPGNENSIYRVINGLTRMGAKVVHRGNAAVHVSGHSAAGELLYTLNNVSPRSVMPIQGEVRQLVAAGQHAFQADDLGAHHPLLDDVQSAGVASDQAADLAGAARREIDTELQPVFGESLLQ